METMISKRSKLAVLLVLVTSAVIARPAEAARIEGVEFPERISSGGVDLALRGLALLRYKVLFRAYVAALYLDPEVGVEQVLDDVPRRLEIEYFWGIPAHLFAEATLDGIEKNVDGDSFRELGPRIARFNALYTDVRPGDRYQLTYRPGVGTELALNGEVRGIVEGADFAAALFAIWLGDEPFSVSMKQQLLDAPG